MTDIVRYRVSEDLQGGNFGMDREQAIDWATLDDNDGLVETLQELKSEDVMEFIAVMWALKFRKVRKDKKNMEGDFNG